MKATAQNLSNNILVRAKREHIAVTPMKLQKLLYYVCVQYVKKTGILPIFERFEPWPYGPVIPSVYSEFKTFGSSPIKSYARNAEGKAKMVDEDANPVLKSCIDDIWNKYKNWGAVDLSKKTHTAGSGWYAAYQRSGETISEEEMRNDTSGC
ncbi:type II toxin-antitoxin system antitoxin SocA domain-containing protein [Oscillibacter sp.]|uniref:Panacea domain-containing protein n=1 Tax=Oscillibacter sp. TaxID=1945593 RepID=UPI0028A2449E|nr:type II toxin-antitoxin system antitoxin SocA domain-containing protein [Oscillibacter sp.]